MPSYFLWGVPVAPNCRLPNNWTKCCGRCLSSLLLGMPSSTASHFPPWRSPSLAPGHEALRQELGWVSGAPTSRGCSAPTAAARALSGKADRAKWAWSSVQAARLLHIPRPRGALVAACHLRLQCEDTQDFEASGSPFQGGVWPIAIHLGKSCQVLRDDFVCFLADL